MDSIGRRRALAALIAAVVGAGATLVVLLGPLRTWAGGDRGSAACPGRALAPAQAREADAYATVLRTIQPTTFTGPMYLDRSLATTATTGAALPPPRTVMLPAVVDCLTAGRPGLPVAAVDGIDDPRLPRSASCNEPTFGCMGASGRGPITDGVLVSLSPAPAGWEGAVRWTVVNGIGGTFATVHLVRRGRAWRVTTPDAPAGVIN